MSLSGIAMAPRCQEAHARQKGATKGAKLDGPRQDIQWTIYKITDDFKYVDVDSSTEKSFTLNDVKKMSKEEVRERVQELWMKLVSDLPDNEGRYVVFDYISPTTSGSYKETLRFITWSPETGPVKSKMLYSSTKDLVMKTFDMQKELFLSTKNEDDISDAFDKLMVPVKV